MYKKLIALLVSGLAVLPLLAQIPNINNQHFFQPNKAYPYKPALFLNQSPGSGGAGVVWDFSRLIFQDDADTTVSVAPATTPAFLRCGIRGMDTATICLVNRSSATHRNDNYHYYKNKGGKITELGSDQDNGLNEDVNFQYSRARIFSLMPFTYLAKSADSFNGTYFSYLSGPHTTSGADSFLADGYGTLKVAGTIYNHCVRIRQVANWVDNNAILGRNNYRYERYTWYSTDKEGPVLTMEPDTHTGVIANYYFPEKKPNGVKGARTEDLLALYPNPATGQLFIRFKNTPVPPVQLTLFNTLGQIVLIKSLSGRNDCIDISRLPNGTYWYRASDKDGSHPGASFIKQ